MSERGLGSWIYPTTDYIGKFLIKNVASRATLQGAIEMSPMS